MPNWLAKEEICDFFLFLSSAVGNDFKLSFFYFEIKLLRADNIILKEDRGPHKAKRKFGWTLNSLFGRHCAKEENWKQAKFYIFRLFDPEKNKYLENKFHFSISVGISGKTMVEL